MPTPRHYAQIQDQRDETFERVRRAFRWTVAGAVTGVTVIIGVVAHEIPGRASVASTSNNASGTAATAPATPSAGGGVGNTGGGNTGVGNTGGGAVSPQVPAPAPTRSAPTAVSGGTGW